jgi:hypothetical protein
LRAELGYLKSEAGELAERAGGAASRMGGALKEAGGAGRAAMRDFLADETGSMPDISNSRNLTDVAASEAEVSKAGGQAAEPSTAMTVGTRVKLRLSRSNYTPNRSPKSRRSTMWQTSASPLAMKLRRSGLRCLITAT